MTVAFYPYNKVDSATITASSENASYSLSNLKDPRRTKTYRSLTNSDSVVFDLGTATAVDAVFIVPNKANGFKVTSIVAQFNTTNTWTSPAFTTTLTIDSAKGVARSEFTTKTYRYVRLVLTSTSGYCELSSVYIGPKVSYVDSDFGYPLQTNVDDLSVVTKNRYGQRFIDVVNQSKTFSGSIEYISPDNIDGFLDMLSYVSIVKPIYISFASSAIAGVDRYSGMYYIKSEPSPRLNSGNYWSASMSFEEAQ